jgi:hypothetical protein
MKSYKIFEISNTKLSFAWYDLWVGTYIDSDNRKIYLCLIPTILLTIKY